MPEEKLSQPFITEVNLCGKRYVPALVAEDGLMKSLGLTLRRGKTNKTISYVQDLR